MYTCSQCGRKFTRPDNLQRHRKLNCNPPRPETIATSDKHQSNETQTRKREHDHENQLKSPAPKQSKVAVHEAVEKFDDILEHIQDPELIKIYKANWRQIRSSVKKGKILTKYNCFLPDLNIGSIVTCAEKVFGEQKSAFKLNLSFGFILKNSETDERRFYYSSGNTKLFPAPHLISDRDTFNLFIHDLEQIDPLDYAREQRPNR